MDGWVGGLMDGWMDGWTDRHDLHLKIYLFYLVKTGYRLDDRGVEFKSQ
jgi:hypothetical protein